MPERTAKGSFLVPRKVRFLAMTMFEQAQCCSFGLTKTFFSRSSKSAFSRHGNVRASSTLFIWVNENVLSRSSKSAFARHDNVRASSTLFIWVNENVLSRSSKSAFARHDNVRASSTLLVWLNENDAFLEPTINVKIVLG